ncbi:MAG: 3D domain-containing protein [Candidatus Paceibacterota bacterium]
MPKNYKVIFASFIILLVFSVNISYTNAQTSTSSEEILTSSNTGLTSRDLQLLSNAPYSGIGLPPSLDSITQIYKNNPPFTRIFGYGSIDETTNGQVSRLQNVLGIEPTGYFGPITQELLRVLQELASDEILKPAGLTEGTGYFGIYTLKYFNSGKVPGLLFSNSGYTDSDYTPPAEPDESATSTLSNGASIFDGINSLLVAATSKSTYDAFKTLGQGSGSLKTLTGVQLTYYSHDEKTNDKDTMKFKSATGAKLKYPDQNGGVYSIAVDPKVIPLKSRLLIKCANGSKAISGIAVDTGGKVKGKHIDIFSRKLRPALPCSTATVYVRK